MTAVIQPRQEPTDPYAVIVGLGYVGLPLAQQALRCGVRVVGLDSSPAVVEGLGAGRSHVDDLADDDVQEMLRGGLHGHQRSEDGHRSRRRRDLRPDAALGGWRTRPLGGPVSRRVDPRAAWLPGRWWCWSRQPTPAPPRSSCCPSWRADRACGSGRTSASRSARSGSTPATRHFGIAQHPQGRGRGDAGPARSGRWLSTPQFIESVVPARGTREAEMAKLLENTYRHVNIALVNEMVQFCHELDIDLWNVIELAKTKPFGFQAFYPGPGSAVTAFRSIPTTFRIGSNNSWAIHSASWSWPRRSTPRCPAMWRSGPRTCSTTTGQRSTARPCCCSASPTRPTSPTGGSLRPRRWPSACSGWGPRCSITIRYVGSLGCLGGSPSHRPGGRGSGGRPGHPAAEPPRL